MRLCTSSSPSSSSAARLPGSASRVSRNSASVNSVINRASPPPAALASPVASEKPLRELVVALGGLRAALVAQHVGEVGVGVGVAGRDGLTAVGLRPLVVLVLEGVEHRQIDQTVRVTGVGGLPVANLGAGQVALALQQQSEAVQGGGAPPLDGAVVVLDRGRPLASCGRDVAQGRFGVREARLGGCPEVGLGELLLTALPLQR